VVYGSHNSRQHTAAAVRAGAHSVQIPNPAAHKRCTRSVVFGRDGVCRWPHCYTSQQYSICGWSTLQDCCLRPGRQHKAAACGQVRIMLIRGSSSSSGGPFGPRTHWDVHPLTPPRPVRARTGAYGTWHYRGAEAPSDMHTHAKCSPHVHTRGLPHGITYHMGSSVARKLISTQAAHRSCESRRPCSPLLTTDGKKP
jgi:hypothetical protein